MVMEYQDISSHLTQEHQQDLQRPQIGTTEWRVIYLTKIRCLDQEKKKIKSANEYNKKFKQNNQ